MVNFKETRNYNFEIFCQKFRQIEETSALLSQNENKLSRIFRLCDFDGFLPYPKLVWTPDSLLELFRNESFFVCSEFDLFDGQQIRC